MPKMAPACNSGGFPSYPGHFEKKDGKHSHNPGSLSSQYSYSSVHQFEEKNVSLLLKKVQSDSFVPRNTLPIASPYISVLNAWRPLWKTSGLKKMIKNRNGCSKFGPSNLAVSRLLVSTAGAINLFRAKGSPRCRRKCADASPPPTAPPSSMSYCHQTGSGLHHLVHFWGNL